MKYTLLSLIQLTSASLVCVAMTPAYATTFTLSGATFNAPSSCVTEGATLSCLEGDDAYVFSVSRVPLGREATAGDSTERITQWVKKLHDAKAVGVRERTASRRANSFVAMGSYRAVGDVSYVKFKEKKGRVRFVSIWLDGDDEIWQLLELVGEDATMTRMDEIAAEIERTLVLPKKSLRTKFGTAR